VFLGQTEGLQTRGEDFGVGTFRQDRGGERGAGIQHMLAIVENEEHRPSVDEFDGALGWRAIARLCDAKNVGNGVRHVIGIGDRCEIAPVNANGEIRGKVGRGLQSQPRLATAAETRECYQGSGAQQFAHACEFTCTPDETGRTRRQAKMWLIHLTPVTSARLYSHPWRLAMRD